MLRRFSTVFEFLCSWVFLFSSSSLIFGFDVRDIDKLTICEFVSTEHIIHSVLHHDVCRFLHFNSSTCWIVCIVERYVLLNGTYCWMHVLLNGMLVGCYVLLSGKYGKNISNEQCLCWPSTERQLLSSRFNSLNLLSRSSSFSLSNHNVTVSMSSYYCYVTTASK